MLHPQTFFQPGVEPGYHTLDLNTITESFNERFEGQILPDCDPIHQAAGGSKSRGPLKQRTDKTHIVRVPVIKVIVSLGG